MKRTFFIVLTVLILTSSTASRSFAAGGTCPASVPSDITSCYYIDFEGGSDSNSGTTKNAPWKHAPGMTGTVNGVGPGAISDYSGTSCQSGCNQPNVGFIFKGGVTWTATAFPWVWRPGGTSLTSRVYVGVDPTWYSGTSWSRPKFDFGGSSYPRSKAKNTFAAGSNGAIIMWAPIKFVVWDNFEFKNWYWNADVNSGGFAVMNINTSNTSGAYHEIKNNYFHGWSHEPYMPNHTGDGCAIILGDTQGYDVGTSAHDNIFDGSDVDDGNSTNVYALGYEKSCSAIFGGPYIIYNNYFKGVSNGAVITTTNTKKAYFFQNTCDSVQASFQTGVPPYSTWGQGHTQCFESNNDIGALVFNNIAKNSYTGVQFWMGTYQGYTSYFFNNVIYDPADAANYIVGAYPVGESTAGTFNIFNNTIQTGKDSGTQNYKAMGCASGIYSCVWNNNHYITSYKQEETCTGGNCIQAYNYFHTKSSATSEGYLSSVLEYPFTPPLGGVTLGTGKNLSSLCSKLSNDAPHYASTACLSGTSAGVGYNTSIHTVINHNPGSTRSLSSAWDIGAYGYIGNHILGSGPQFSIGSGATVTIQ